MKKTLLATTLLIALSASTLSANAFSWSSLNPANWGTCPKCERTASCKCKKQKCTPSCEKKERVCPVEQKASCPCQTTPKCNSCGQSAPCDACDKLQQQTERR
ncbi:MAG: hypothetical protein NC200_00440 [Candidatus Gastranaerophilales bacterium]|nr:hypothetical protein [Candidatus Gastranaerophilales bacterium]